LSQLTKFHEKFIWGDAQGQALKELKSKLSFTPILRRQIRDCPFQLHINRNALGLGTILAYLDEEN
jgi:hypothetical protein